MSLPLGIGDRLEVFFLVLEVLASTSDQLVKGCKDRLLAQGVAVQGFNLRHLIDDLPVFAVQLGIADIEDFAPPKDMVVIVYHLMTPVRPARPSWLSTTV